MPIQVPELSRRELACLQEITRLRQEAERRGRSLRSRIAAQITPRKPGRRRAATSTTTKKNAAQDPAAPSTTPTITTTAG